MEEDNRESGPGNIINGEMDPLLDNVHHRDNDDETSSNKSTSQGFSPFLIFICFTIVLSTFQFGYSTGVMNIPQMAITCGDGAPSECSGRDSQTFPSCIPMSKIQWSTVVSAFTIGGLIGGSFGGRLADKLGRKKLLLINNLTFIVGGILMGVALNFPMLMVGRFVNGIGCGIGTSVVPM